MADPVPPEVAVEAWLQNVLGSSIVGMSLPQDVTQWASTGFVTIGPIYGNIPTPHLPHRSSVAQVDTWGANPHTLHPDRATPGILAARIIRACDDNVGLGVLSTRPGFDDVRIYGAWPTVEPRQEAEDEASYGLVTMDVEVHWIEIPL